MGNSQQQQQQLKNQYPHFQNSEHLLDSSSLNLDNLLIELKDESPEYRYDFYDRNKQLLEFHILNQKKSILLNKIKDKKEIFKLIFEYLNIKDIFNLSFTCRLFYLYWTRDDEIYRNLIPQFYKNLILELKLPFNIYGIRNWKDCCRNLYCKDMWKRLHLNYDFINGSICSNNNNTINGNIQQHQQHHDNSSDDEDDEFSMLDANSSKKSNHSSKKSDKSSNTNMVTTLPQIEELRIHFICNEKKQQISRYLKSILKYCKEPQDDNYRLSRKFSSYFDRRVARIKEKNISNSSHATSLNGNTTSNNGNHTNEYEIQCLVGSSLRPNCACKFILIDLSDQLLLNNFNEKATNQELINEYLKKEIDCGETIKEYLNTINNDNNLNIVIVGLSYERKCKNNLNMIKLCKALSNEYSLPYIEIDIGKRNQRRNLLYFYSVYCHSKKMTRHQLTFLKTNNTSDEWLL